MRPGNNFTLTPLVSRLLGSSENWLPWLFSQAPLQHKPKEALSPVLPLRWPNPSNLFASPNYLVSFHRIPFTHLWILSLGFSPLEWSGKGRVAEFWNFSGRPFTLSPWTAIGSLGSAPSHPRTLASPASSMGFSNLLFTEFKNKLYSGLWWWISGPLHVCKIF